VDEVLKEKQRRTMGKETAATREQMEKEARMRDFAAAKREKDAQKRERDRLKLEIEKDKAERRARGGTLSSVKNARHTTPINVSQREARRPHNPLVVHIKSPKLPLCSLKSSPG
jgi:hypothetical protein